MMREFRGSAGRSNALDPEEGAGRNKSKGRKTRKPRGGDKDSRQTTSAAASGGPCGAGSSGGGSSRKDRPWNQVRATQKAVNAFGLSDTDLNYLKTNTRYNEQEIR